MRKAAITGLVAVNTVWLLLLLGCAPSPADLQHPTPISTPTLEPAPTAGMTEGVLSPTPSDQLNSAPSVGKNINHIDGAILVEIPAGEFEMGAASDIGYQICLQYRDDCQLDDFLDEQPVHLVFLDEYSIYRQEVTNAMYRLCVEVGGCALPAFTDFYNSEQYHNHPVVYVTWYAAQAYCNWAGGRLPTEAEWEKAAKGADGRIFPWGDAAASCESANLSGCSAEMTMPAGSLPAGASPYGVLDMAGNAAEWVADWYDPTYYSVSSFENPLGPEVGELKVYRGGSWKNPGVGLRVTNRGGNFPEIFSTGIGFRCVIDLDQ